MTEQRPIYVLGDVVRQQTVAYRKGEIVKTEERGGMRVITIDAFPEAPYHGVLVDMHFIEVGFTEAAADREGFLQAFKAACADHGEFTDISLARFAQGPSYIEIGGWIGDQTLALLFMALCKFHEIGAVITPASLGLFGEEATDLAGRGAVMMILNPEKV